MQFCLNECAKALNEHESILSLACHVHTCMYNCLTDNYIDGAEFLTLSESEVKSMVPPIGLARKILRLQPHTRVIQYHSSSYIPDNFILIFETL